LDQLLDPKTTSLFAKLVFLENSTIKLLVHVFHAVMQPEFLIVLNVKSLLVSHLQQECGHLEKPAQNAKVDSCLNSQKTDVFPL